MAESEYELVVIGSGPAGHHAAIQAAKLGRRAAIVERLSCVGGVCINTGTIPSKTLREAVLYLSGFQQRGLYGYSYRVKQNITIQDLMFRCHHVIEKENDVYRNQFARNGVDLLEGQASFVDPHTIKVEGVGPPALVRAERFVIATGTVPAVSLDVPIDGTSIIDADGIFNLPKIPATMIVVGAGVVGMEYACMFSTLGAMVTVVDGRKRLLEFVDGEIIEALMYHMRENRVTFRCGETVERVERDLSGGVTAHLQSRKTLHADVLLYAVGRHGNTAALNLAAAGLERDGRGRLKVDGNFRTAVPHIFAAGDVVGFPSLASVSMEQGRVASANSFGLGQLFWHSDGDHAGPLPVRALHDPRDFLRRAHGRGTDHGRRALRGRHGALSRDRARPDHRRHDRTAQADLPQRDGGAARCPRDR